MSFDDIPEDKTESYPCPEPDCEGNITLISNNTACWECDECEFSQPDK